MLSEVEKKRIYNRRKKCKTCWGRGTVSVPMQKDRITCPHCASPGPARPYTGFGAGMMMSSEKLIRALKKRNIERVNKGKRKKNLTKIIDRKLEELDNASC